MVPPLVYMKGVRLRRDFGESMPRGRRIKSLAVVTSVKRSLAGKGFVVSCQVFLVYLFCL